MTKDEVLMMADVLSREKEIDREIVFEAIEAALATATRKRHREDRLTGVAATMRPFVSGKSSRTMRL